MARYSFTDVADGQQLPAARVMEMQVALERLTVINPPVDAGFSWFNQGGAAVGGDWNSGNPIGFWATMTASTAGSIVDYGAITSPFVVLNGNTPPSVAVGDLVIKRG